MTPRLRTVFAVLLLSFPFASTGVAETVIAFWDFNTPYDFPNDTAQIVHDATIGSGTLFQQRADIDGNGKGGVLFDNPSLGISVPDGRAMAWDDVAKSGDNDAEFFVVFSTDGLSTIQVRFDVQGNGDPDNEIISYDLKYDTNPLEDVTVADVNGTIKDFQNGISVTILNNQPLNANGDNFISHTVDLSAITALNNQSTVALRFDDFEQNDSMRIDNILVTGVTAIPEPSTVTALMLIGGITVCRRRSRA
ncbi:MAG: PEP-CTERM sorting domain-containing protein [Planctomycetota bacterium]